MKEFVLLNSTDAPVTNGLSSWIGIFLVFVSVVVQAFDGIAYSKNIQLINRNEPLHPAKYSLAKLVPVILSIAGLVLVVYLLLTI